MNSRLELDAHFREILGSSNVYFQPPESIQLKYPCIVYHLQDINSIRADDMQYRQVNGYYVTYISRIPDDDSVFSKKILSFFKLSRFDRWFASDNLNHYVYDIYF